MKFLCVQCDEPMKLKRNNGVERGSLTVLFGCPGCGWEIAMLTNPAETSMVSSLGIRVGGRAGEPLVPLESTSANLAGGCPFTGAAAGDAAPAEGQRPPAWTPEAEARMQRVPEFVRPMAKRRIEQYARECGHTTITDEIVLRARADVGM